MQRRDLLLGVSRLAALVAWQRLFAPAAHAQPALRNWHESADVFTLGVASGEPLPNSVVLWTRLAPRPLQPDGGMPTQPVLVRWELARDARFAQMVQQGEAVASPGKAHSVHVQVQGLQSGREYFYRFIAAGQSSPVGRTRTAPDPTARTERLRVALASCQHYEMGYFTAHREMAASDIDCVVFVGDYIYEGHAPSFMRLRKHPIGLEGHFTLANYRMHHASYKLDADLRACHAAHPWLLMWDDHEVRNDYDGLSDPDRQMGVQEFARLRADAFQAYYEHQPISPRRAPVGPNAAMATQYRWGQLADLWLLDTRQFRSPNDACTGAHAPMRGRVLWRCDAVNDVQRSMLGSAQEQWLASSLARSTGQWRLIAQTTQISPSPFSTPLGPLLYADGWDVFPQARQRLMSAIAQPRVPDVVLLGGDVHRHVAANLRLNPLDPASPIIASEFVTSSIATRGLSELMSQWARGANPDLLHFRSDQRGYTLLDVTPERLLCDFRATAHPVRADSRFHTQASFVVERGVAGPRKA